MMDTLWALGVKVRNIHNITVASRTTTLTFAMIQNFRTFFFSNAFPNIFRQNFRFTAKEEMNHVWSTIAH